MGASLRRAAGAEQAPGYGCRDLSEVRAMSGWCRPEIMILTMKVKCIGSLIGRSEAAVRMKAQVKGISLILRGDFHQSTKYP